MAKSPELIVKIGANAKEFEKTLEGLPATANKSLTGLKVAAAASAVAFAALAAGAAASVQEFKNFEKGFSDVVTLLDKSSFATKNFKEGVEDLQDGIIDLRAKTGQSFETLNKGLFDLVSAGVAAEDSIQVLNVATDLALAGATQASVAVDGLTSALNAYGFESEKAQEVAEKFFTAQKFGKTTIEELSTDFGKVGASAAALGVSFDEVLASVSAATLAGIKTNEAYTGLKATLSSIIKPSKEALDEAAALGVEFNSTALKAKGFDGFLQDIVTSEGFTSTSLQKLFGSMEALNFITAITGAQSGDFAKILKAVADEQARAGTFTDALAAKNDTLDQKLATLEGSFSSLKVVIGDRLAPAFGILADEATKALDAIRIGLEKLENPQAQFANWLLELAGASERIGNDFSLQFDTGSTALDPFQSIIDSSQRAAAETAKNFQATYEANEKAANDAAENDRRLAQEAKELKDKQDAEDAERAARKAEADAKRKEEQQARDEEDLINKRLLEDEQFEEDFERLNQRLSGFDELENQFKGLAELRELDLLKTKAKTADQRQKIDQATALATKRFYEQSTDSALDSLQTIVGEESAVGKAIFLIRKARAIAQAIVATNVAAAEALAVPPAPNFGLAAAAKTAGFLNVAAIAATAITGAAEGGIVKGGQFGRDTQPFLLAKDEIIVPSKLNPLSPNFDQTFGGGGFGGGNVKVEIGLEENASKILTVKQREDRALGIQR
jgi:TP901 family phage tail tape measure protein